jgi:hypothetical protein
MDRGERFIFEIRAVLVTWRAVMRQIRDGLLPDSRESARRVTARSMNLLSDIGSRYPGWASDPQAAGRMRDAREEIHGASDSDLDEAGEQNA